MQFYHDRLHFFPATYTRERKTHLDFASTNPGEQPSQGDVLSILPLPLMQSLIIVVNESMHLHRGFLESAGRQNSCDHLNALPHSTAASWLPHCMDLHACMQMHALTESAGSCWVGQSIQVVTKNTVHWKRSALSRKPLWPYHSFTCYLLARKLRYN